MTLPRACLLFCLLTLPSLALAQPSPAEALPAAERSGIESWRQLRVRAGDGTVHTLDHQSRRIHTPSLGADFELDTELLRDVEEAIRGARRSASSTSTQVDGVALSSPNLEVVARLIHHTAKRRRNPTAVRHLNLAKWGHHLGYYQQHNFELIFPSRGLQQAFQRLSRKQGVSVRAYVWFHPSWPIGRDHTALVADLIFLAGKDAGLSDARRREPVFVSHQQELSSNALRVIDRRGEVRSLRYPERAGQVKQVRLKGALRDLLQAQAAPESTARRAGAGERLRRARTR